MWQWISPPSRVVSVFRDGEEGDGSDRFAGRLEMRLVAAAERARDTGRPVLLSLVERVGATDPLEVLDVLARQGVARDDVTGRGDVRMYWSHPATGFAFGALGAAATVCADGADRFSAVDRAWRALTEGALVDDPSGGLDGVGPLLAGGLAFDSDGPRTARWRGFPGAFFFVPRLHLVVTGGAGWLTLTLRVAPDGRPDIASAELGRVRSAVLAASRVAGPDPSEDGEPRATDALTQHDVRPAAEWRALVGEAVDVIRTGALEKVVLAREVHAVAPRELDATATLRQVRAAHRDAYVFGLWRGTRAFIGATPERLVRVERGTVLASSLAGSAPRGATPASDARFARDLMHSAKDRAEHDVVRRTLCATLALHCDEVTAAAEPSILSLPQVHHLHTPVRARLRPGGTLLQVAAALHPTPAVGGSPRDAALRFIRTRERLDRGWYAAPIGWLQRDRGELAVALRCALLTGREASLFAGCGVMAASEPDREYAETLLKLQPMMRALTAALRDDGATTVGAATGEAERVR